MHRTARRKVVPWAVAIVLGLPFLGLVPSAAAHVDAPTVTALHAFVGDPLFGLDTPESTLVGILPDERTAMASTTKIWALDLTVHALEDGCIELDDEITITAEEAGWGGSSMQDVNGAGIEEDEVISLEDLLRGMMYPSGNDATYAIARHVAENCIPGGSTWEDFVDEMNAHAAELGVTDTNFENPNGYDDPFQANVTPTPEQFNHYTTARELTMLMSHGLEDSYLREVVGFVGTWTATTQGPNGPKTYSLPFPFFGGYPGYEGAKGGGTQNCNGPNNGCMVMSAKRIGRRVLLSFMQGQPWSEEVGMLDFGFGTIFHPDSRGSSTGVGAAEKHGVDCFSSSRCVSAVLPTAGNVKLVSWEPDVDGSTVGKLDEAELPKSALPPGSGNGQGPAGDVAVSPLPSGAIVVASRKGSSVELSRWSMDGSGALSLLDDGIKAGPATTMDLQSVYGDMFLTAFTDPDGSLVLRSWQLDGTGLTKRDTYRDESRVYGEVAIAGPLTTDVFTGHRAVTAAATASALVQGVWGVDETTGAISLLGELVQGGTAENVEIAPFFVPTVFEGELFPPVYYATAYRTGGELGVNFYRIAGTGAPVLEGFLTSTGISAEDVAIARLGIGGVLTATRDTDGDVRLVAWEAARNADNSITPDRVSEHDAPDAGSLDLARVPSTHADGDYVTAVTDPLGGPLRLRAYRSGDRPF